MWKTPLAGVRPRLRPAGGADSGKFGQLAGPVSLRWAVSSAIRRTARKIVDLSLHDTSVSSSLPHAPTQAIHKRPPQSRRRCGLAGDGLDALFRGV